MSRAYTLFEELFDEIQANFLIVGAFVAPVLANFHLQEEVDFAVQNFLQFLAGCGANILDGPATLAQHNALLAVPLHIDDLVNPHAAIAFEFPVFRLRNRRYQLLPMVENECPRLFQPTIQIAIYRFIMPGPIMATIAIISTIKGSAMMMSRSRMVIKSIHPP